MATINGARSLGIDAWVGSLEVGKRADVVLHDYARPELRPGYDPVHSLVYSAQSAGVQTVLVDGEVVLERGRFTRVDAEAELRRVDAAAARLAERTGWLEYAAAHTAAPWPVIR